MSDVIRSHVLFRLYNPFWQARSGQTLTIGGAHGEFLPKKKIDTCGDVRTVVGRKSLGLFNTSAKKMTDSVPSFDWDNSSIVKVHQSRWPRVKFCLSGTLRRLFNYVSSQGEPLRTQILDELEDESVHMFAAAGHQVSLLVSSGGGWIDALRETTSKPTGAEEWELFWSTASGFNEELQTLCRAAVKFLSTKQEQFIYAPADVMKDTREVQDILFRCLDPVACSSTSLKYENSILKVDLACHASGEFMMDRFRSRDIPVVGNLFEPPNISQLAVVCCMNYPRYEGEPMIPGHFYSFRFMNYYCLVGYAEVAGGSSSLVKSVNVGRVLAGGLSHVEHIRA